MSRRKTAVRGRYAAPVCDVAHIHSMHGFKKHSLAESVSTTAKLCVQKNMIGGSQTHQQQRSIPHLWWKNILRRQVIEGRRETRVPTAQESRGRQKNIGAPMRCLPRALSRSSPPLRKTATSCVSDLERRSNAIRCDAAAKSYTSMFCGPSEDLSISYTVKAPQLIKAPGTLLRSCKNADYAERSLVSSGNLSTADFTLEPFNYGWRKSST
uniref:SFRICE_003323 n=1 Tax=Spodoptera frugiperda TaxID=7108 RepID=A0A2H1X2Y1_SPOFR